MDRWTKEVRGSRSMVDRTMEMSIWTMTKTKIAERAVDSAEGVQDANLRVFDKWYNKSMSDILA
jgi:hypothetical protein